MRMKLLTVLLLLSACDSAPMTPEQVAQRKVDMARLGQTMRENTAAFAPTAATLTPRYAPPVYCQYYQWGNMVSC